MDFSASYQMTTSQAALSWILAIVQIVALWKVFTKANVAGWHAIIPFLNAYDEFKIATGSGWKFLLLLIPIVNIVIYILYTISLAKAFGKGGGFAVGLIFLPMIFYLILGFGDAQYIGPNGQAA